MKIRENCEVIVEKHPHSESLNKKLMEDIKDSYFYSPEDNINHTNVIATQHNVKSEDKTKSMQLIENWVSSLLDRAYLSSFLSAPKEYGARLNMNIWFAKYNKGDYTLDHHHINYAQYAFVYFVNCPKGSSPLVFTTSGKRIKAEEGKIVIFPPQLYHHVPKNKCDGRITLSGNVGMVN
tara:strand:+ start:79 stop:615 length:537 start_codon:yes stop_codon:yes gene_type:complete